MREELANTDKDPQMATGSADSGLYWPRCPGFSLLANVGCGCDLIDDPAPEDDLALRRLDLVLVHLFSDHA
jgi:hypothetical protein